ncbi:protein of unknown function [Pararobbsia alpina]
MMYQGCHQGSPRVTQNARNLTRVSSVLRFDAAIPQTQQAFGHGNVLDEEMLPTQKCTLSRKTKKPSCSTCCRRLFLCHALNRV